jgi:hypothetical protein
MKIDRYFSQRLLSSIVGVFLMTMLGCHHEPHAIIRVNGPAQGIAPPLQLGQVIRWEAAPGTGPFAVHWNGQVGPCQELTLYSKPNNVGVESASCKVILLPVGAKVFVYGVYSPSRTHPLDDDQDIVPCDGCFYPSGQLFQFEGERDRAAIKVSGKMLAVLPTPYITVGCGNGAVQLNPPEGRIPANLKIFWGENGSMAITSVDFHGASGVSCTTSSPFSCTFSGTQTVPLPYTVSASGSGSTTCGVDNQGHPQPTGSGEGVIDPK